MKPLPLPLLFLASPLGGTLPAIAPVDADYLMVMAERSPGVRVAGARSDKVRIARLAAVAKIHTFEKPADPITAVPVRDLIAGKSGNYAEIELLGNTEQLPALATLSIDIPDLSPALCCVVERQDTPRPPDIIIPPVAVQPVPEPGTWACMVVGFAVVGGALRQRKRRLCL